MDTIISPRKRLTKIILSRLSIFILIIASLASWLNYSDFFGESRDYSSYEIFFEHVLSQSCDNTQAFRFEVGFQYLSCLIAYIAPSSKGIYATSILISLIPKLFVVAMISAASPFKFLRIPISFILALLIYMTRFFPLHELTQLRISIGISFMLIAFLYMQNETIRANIKGKNSKKQSSIILNWKRFAVPLLAIFTAILFHSSLLALVPFIFLQDFANSRRFILISSFILFVVLFFSSSLINNFAVGNFSAGIFYIGGSGEDVNLFSSQKILDWLLLMMGLILVDPKNRMSLSCLCIFAYSFSMFYGFSAFPVFAHRLSEAFQVFSVLFVASMGNKNQVVFVLPIAIAFSILNVWIFTTRDLFF